ncbi:acyltransferase family protein [Fluviicola taffensis]|uniref:Acyltransferase 3 n=1 Tax=Fluviicola taffensis (strain DSM 16823 / NCIMB 13979 / RW262) TaxID=755732 RepID=F2IJ02_FLUTR|nr:acyltransferase [Fluviicola taffensis]AEA43860.1 acyltransferase 3 [Fluviicola taffensis DSM 16823]
MRDFKAISHFKGLNTLRFFAAFLVVIHHAESLRKDHELGHLKGIGIFENGQHAVSFFFVLSGFLITYLLLKEREVKKDISIKQFYIKRVFRIWPLYFLMVIIGAIIQPYFIEWFNIPYKMPYTFGETWYYFVFFVPGLVNLFFGSNLLEPLWSIGVEEVFYLIWAPLFKWLKKHVLKLILGVIAFKLILICLNTFVINQYTNDLVPKVLSYLIRIHQFEAMAIGGLGAYLVFNHGSKINKSVLYSIPTQLFFYSLILVFIFFGANIHSNIWYFFFENPIVSAIIPNALFLYLIIGVSVVDRNLFTLENRVFSYLGEISYGIYMFHLLILSQIIELLKGFVAGSGMVWETLFYYGVSLPLIIGICALSKRTLEAYFEKKKQKVLRRMKESNHSI